MRRVCTLTAAAALALGAAATPAPAAATVPPGGGEVRALSVVPASGRAEVIIAVAGTVDVRDFTLESPARIVVDLRGATLTAPAAAYDKVVRGGITNVRVGQFRDDVVRIVVDLDAARRYTITRREGEVRIAVTGDSSAFAAWRGPAAAATDAVTTVGQAEPEPALETAAVARPRSPRAAARAVPQPRITVTYQDADIRDVIAAFAAFSGRTIVVGKGVTGTVSAEVRDQPWDVALRAILQTQGFAAKEESSGIITVDSYANIAAQRAAEPLTTQVIAINYARAGSLVETVKGLLSRDCGPAAAPTPESQAGASQGDANCPTRGSVAADSATNRLIITDVPSRLDDIASYIKQLDIRTPQIAIKAKIILVNRTNIEDLGISYDLGTSDQFFNKLVQRKDPSTFKPVDSDGDGVPDRMGGGTPLPQNTNVVNIGGNALAAIANANSRVVQPALSLIFSTALGKFNLTTFLDALQEVRLADIQAEPSIVTLDNREAQILVGEETPIRVVDLGSQSQGSGSQVQLPRATVQFKETGIILKVTPHVTNNRQILMTLAAERSNLQAAPADLGYTFQKQRAENQLLVNDGETAVIGGLTVTQVTKSKVGIPILVDLPIIGRLFGQTRTEETKQDLLILVTPHIIDEGEKLGTPTGKP